MAGCGHFFSFSFSFAWQRGRDEALPAALNEGCGREKEFVVCLMVTLMDG
jgi:hypothetical protein